MGVARVSREKPTTTSTSTTTERQVKSHKRESASDKADLLSLDELDHVRTFISQRSLYSGTKISALNIKKAAKNDRLESGGLHRSPDV